MNLVTILNYWKFLNKILNVEPPYELVCSNCYVHGRGVIVLQYDGKSRIMIEITGNVTGKSAGYQSVEHYIWKCSQCNFRKCVPC